MGSSAAELGKLRDDAHCVLKGYREAAREFARERELTRALSAEYGRWSEEAKESRKSTNEHEKVCREFGERTRSIGERIGMLMDNPEARFPMLLDCNAFWHRHTETDWPALEAELESVRHVSTRLLAEQSEPDGPPQPGRKTKAGKRRGRKTGDRKPDAKEGTVIKAHRHCQSYEVTARNAKVTTKDGRPDTQRVKKIIRAYKAANPGHKFPAGNS